MFKEIGSAVGGALDDAGRVTTQTAVRTGRWTVRRVRTNRSGKVVTSIVVFVFLLAFVPDFAWLVILAFALYGMVRASERAAAA